MAALQENGIDWEEVTLHVGAGTFKPVDANTLGGHTMHREFFTVSRSLVERLRDQLEVGKPIVSVGTTSLRCLESLFYLGASFTVGKTAVVDGTVEVGQWVAEDPLLTSVNPLKAVTGLIDLMHTNRLTELSGYTQLLLTPFAKLKLADGLITNFTSPGLPFFSSSLPLLGMIGDGFMTTR